MEPTVAVMVESLITVNDAAAFEPKLTHVTSDKYFPSIVVTSPVNRLIP